MNNITTCTALIAAGCVFSLGGCDSRDDSRAAGTSQTAPDRDSRTAAADHTDRDRADNTGRNRDDSGRDARTPIDQSQSSEHVRLTADIRREIVAEDMLSNNAKNCKIITDNSGRVWLRGVVDSNDEKDLIERIARQIAGDDFVTNELEVRAG